jgi:hypothetical protein
MSSRQPSRRQLDAAMTRRPITLEGLLVVEARGLPRFGVHACEVVWTARVSAADKLRGCAYNQPR